MPPRRRRGQLRETVFELKKTENVEGVWQAAQPELVFPPRIEHVALS